uniref:Uncharacterized protein n=1 Tax=viral metagenome TaxID=1070528 RepID=A0A6C0E590_9ZZZZ
MNKTYKKNRHGKKKTLKKRVGGVDLVKKCKSTYVTTSVKRKISEAKKIYDRDVKLARKNIKDKTNLKKSIKDIEDFYKFFINNKNLERHKKSETQLFCNPGCKGTFLEPGNKVSSEYLKQYNLNPANPNDKKFIHDMEKKRKTLFGNKKNILIDNFYENASKKYLDAIKKEGAVSLCSPIVDRPKI